MLQDSAEQRYRDDLKPQTETFNGEPFPSDFQQMWGKSLETFGSFTFYSSVFMCK